MNNPYGTLEFLQRISSTEAIDENDAMDLAAYLNDHEGARHSWPGNMLFDFLVNVYEDGSMREYELQALARIVEGVLLQAAGMAAEAAENEPAPLDEDDAPDGALLLPDLTYLDDLEPNGQPGIPDIFYSNMECDCLDWQSSRRRVPANSPGRICRHLARHMFQNLDLLPVKRIHLRKLINWSGASQRGLPPQSEWRILPIGEETLIAAWGNGKLCWVFAPVKDGKLELYSYDLGEKVWSLYNRPTQHRHEDLQAFLDEVVKASESIATAA